MGLFGGGAPNRSEPSFKVRDPSSQAISLMAVHGVHQLSAQGGDLVLKVGARGHAAALR
jgi:hypothetical protein